MCNLREPPSCRDGGYSLIELLISLTILALLLAMVPGTTAAAAVSFVEQNLKSALPIYQSDSSGLPQLAFAGTENRLSFVADLPNGPSGGGLYLIDVGLRPDGESVAVHISPYRPNANASPDASGLDAEVRDLGGAYSRIQFKYFGSPSPGAPAQWQSTWHRSDRLPDLVDIVVTSRAPTSTPNAEYRAELKMRPIL
jgi:prepilin-type N-terminal cleavage/methylation domain-containing protein